MSVLLFLFVGTPITDVGWEYEIEHRQWQMPILREYYLSIDLMEEDENRFLHLHQWDADVSMMEWRQDNITDNTPPSFLKYTLPPQSTAKRNWIVAHGFVAYCRERVEWAEWHSPNQLAGWKALLEDAERRCAVWDVMDDLTAVTVPTSGRRIYLERLKKLVGEDKFLKGEWPDPLPPAAYNSNWFPKY